MAEIKLEVANTRLKLIKPNSLVGTGVNYDTCTFSFDSDWEGYTKTAVFHSNTNEEPIQMIVDENGSCKVPWEAIKDSGILYIGVFGIKDNIEIPTNFITLYIEKGSAGNNAPPPPTLDVYAQIINKIGQMSSDEQERKLAETNRVEAETIREANENTRIANEEVREETEQIRVKNENDRLTKESERINAEESRNVSENDRLIAETNRVNAENTRNDNETIRQNNEIERQTLYSEVKSCLEQMALVGQQIGGGINPNDVGYDVILVAGQSNAVGFGNDIDINFDYSDPRILQYAVQEGIYKDKILIASEPLLHPDTSSMRAVGFPLTFAKHYIQTIPVNRKVLIVPCAKASTGFITGHWKAGNPGNALYEQAIEKCNNAINLNPNNRLVAILWLQGEADTGASGMGNMTQQQYYDELNALINGFRTRIYNATNVPFIIGGMVPEWVAITPNAIPIMEAHKEIPNNLPYTAYVNGVSNAFRADGNIHYNAIGERLMGTEFFKGLLSARINVLDPNAPPIPPINLITTLQAKDSVSLSWTAPSQPPVITNYQIEYKPSSGGTWVIYDHVASVSTSINVDGLNAETNYDFRVSTITANGISEPCTEISVSTKAVPIIPSAYWNIKSTIGVTADENNKVSAVADQSGNARNLTQIDATKQPTKTTFEDKDVIQFTNGTMLKGLFPSGTSYTKMILVYHDDFVKNGFYLSGEAGGHILQRAGGTKLNAGHEGNPSTVVGNTNLVASKWYLIVMTWNYTTGETNFYINGVLDKTGTITSKATGTSALINSYATYTTVGNNIKMLESAVWNQALTIEQINEIKNTMETEYGITLN